MEFILAKVPRYNKLTNEVEGEDLSLVRIDYSSIKNIVADNKTGNAIIHYMVDPKPLETTVSFESIFDTLYKSGLVNLTLLDKAKTVSTKFNKHISTNHGL